MSGTSLLSVDVLVESMAVAVDRRRVRAWVRAALRGENCGGAVTISVVIADDRRLMELCRRFLGRPRRTDVLAFPGTDGKNKKSENVPSAPFSRDPKGSASAPGSGKREKNNEERTEMGTVPCVAKNGEKGDRPLARHLGDVVVNAQRARREARRRGISPLAELALYVLHGVLHLVGYDDQDRESARRMHAQEAAILRRLGYGPVYEAKVKRA